MTDLGEVEDIAIDPHVDLRKCKAQSLAWAHLMHPDRATMRGLRVCLPWGRGIGKSWFVRLLWWALVQRWEFRLRPGAPRPGIRIVLVMPTLAQATKVHGDLILDELESQWATLGGKVNRTTWRISFPGGSWVQFVSSQRAFLARGIRCDVVCCDEADDLDSGMISAIVKPWFTQPHSLRMLVVSGTPRRGRKGFLWEAHHEWPQIAREKKHFRFKSFHATAYDAPEIVDPSYLDDVKSDTPPAIFKREYLCDFDASEGLVYPMFLEGFHVRVPPPGTMWEEIIYCADHGFSDPGCILTVGILGRGKDAIAWVLDEVYETERDPVWWDEQVTRLVGHYPRAKWYPDPANPSVLAGWRKLGANIQKVLKGAGSVENGVTVLQRWLSVRSRRVRGEDGVERREEFSHLFVHPRCKNTIDEFGLYRRKRDPKNPEATLEAIEDANNHALDSLRYGLVHRFPDRFGARKGITHDERATAE